jgi:mRNA interferase MazF
MRRGDVYWAELAPRSGSEQSGRRPVVLVSNDGFNQTPGWRSLIVVPLSTSSSQAVRGPTVVAISAGVAGLTRTSHAICHQVTTVDRAKLGKHIGILPRELLRSLTESLKTAMDLD